MDFTFTSQLHYLVHQSDGEYVAHCLDLDLVGTGSSVDDAVEELNDAVRTVVYFCIKSNAPNASSCCHPAPQEYWDMFRRAFDENNPIIKTVDIAPELAPVNVMECHLTYCLAIAA
ncbi:MAG TPA: hypothetical protein VGF96_18460 [Terracidiphilus sp.]|jgi:hypothetical protein